ncbi:hypothetical protein CEXT_137821 [Caerostris extrusa]|uniref:Uncharacterized protein n=1 Tax=Caerostris extrusa TaxID=172846 RepID=A0AAV4NF58_CAEEX|nr:hypothetical protein CEXT_137821 [Caerostris extrusa]
MKNSKPQNFGSKYPSGRWLNASTRGNASVTFVNKVSEHFLKLFRTLLHREKSAATSQSRSFASGRNFWSPVRKVRASPPSSARHMSPNR